MTEQKKRLLYRASIRGVDHMGRPVADPSQKFTNEIRAVFYVDPLEALNAVVAIFLERNFAVPSILLSIYEVPEDVFLRNEKKHIKDGKLHREGTYDMQVMPHRPQKTLELSVGELADLGITVEDKRQD